jgi:hypothetical protein
VSVARTDNDTWEITESVGATALGVAAARAAETRRENPLIGIVKLSEVGAVANHISLMRHI